MYKEYQNIIINGFPKIENENLLFWNLWNTSYPFEILEKYKERYKQFYSIFNEMWTLCWGFNDSKKINLDKFHSIFKQYYPFNHNGGDNKKDILNSKNILEMEYDNLDDAYLSEACIIQLIHCFNNIYEGISNKCYRINVSDAPISIISVILDSNGLGFSLDNMNLPFVQNEIEAQIKLIKDLSVPQNYTYKDRNIYRDKNAMESIKYKE